VAIGVFLCFWQVAPIAPQLRLAHVVTQELLAALAGAALLFAFAVGYWSVVQLFGDVGFRVGDWIAPLGPSALAILFRALSTLIAVVSLVVLGAVLLSGWLQRHPLGYQVRGTLDEV
jgi:hypothetical protein